MKAVVAVPLAIERAALAALAPDVILLRTGMGPARSAAAAARLAPAGRPLLVAGVAGALSDDLAPGDVVVATEIRGGPAPIAVPSAPLLVAALRRAGLTVHSGPILSVPKVLDGTDARAQALRTGAIAVDTESAVLAAAAATGGRPVVVVRAVSDTPAQPLRSIRIVRNGLSALRSLRAAAPVVRNLSVPAGTLAAEGEGEVG